MLYTITTSFDDVNQKVSIVVPEVRQAYHNVSFTYSGSSKTITILMQTPDTKKQTVGYLFVMYQSDQAAIHLLNEMEKNGDIVEFVGKTIISYSTLPVDLPISIPISAPVEGNIPGVGGGFICSTIHTSVHVPPLSTNYEVTYLVFLVLDGNTRFLEGE